MEIKKIFREEIGLMWILDELKKKKESTALAVVERSSKYTFKDLWQKSEQIAQDLERTGKRTPVVIYGDKNPAIIPTMLAALKTGRAYVPVDISFPVTRLNYIADTVNCCCIYNYSQKEVNSKHIVRNADYVNNVLFSVSSYEEISESCWVHNKDNCYIIFTSGSTGLPKGVPINKDNLLNFIKWFGDYIRPDLSGQNVLNQVSYSFDPSVEMIYVYLASGKTLICVDKDLNGNTDMLLNWLMANDIAVWSSTPSLIELCCNNKFFCEKFFPSLQLFIVGGEVFPKKIVQHLMDSFPSAVINNLYGPTEATVAIAGCVVTREMLNDERSIPIGRVIPEATCLIQSENGDRCIDGEIGELTIISKSVCCGYLNDTELTPKAFFKNFDGRIGYKTGDLVFSDNNMLYFVGRKDYQLKLNGYRIEIEDISNNINKISAVINNAVVPKLGIDGGVEFLAGFVKLKEEYKNKSQLQNNILIRKALRELIPSYMIPRKIYFINEFPLNKNGKIDHNALAEQIE